MDGICRRLRYDTRVSVDKERTLSLYNRCMRCVCSRRCMCFHVYIRFIHTETSFFCSLRCVCARIHFFFHGHIVFKHTLPRNLHRMRYVITLKRVMTLTHPCNGVVFWHAYICFTKKLHENRMFACLYAMYPCFFQMYACVFAVCFSCKYVVG